MKIINFYEDKHPGRIAGFGRQMSPGPESQVVGGPRGHVGHRGGCLCRAPTALAFSGQAKAKEAAPLEHSRHALAGHLRQLTDTPEGGQAVPFQA